jgi:hypothetical protein
MNEDEIIKMIMESDPQRDWTKGKAENESDAFFKPDKDLRIEQTNKESEHEDKFDEPWATTRCSSPEAYKVNIAIYYGSTKIKDIHLVEVDGFRAIVPKPISNSDLRIADKLSLKIAQILSDRCDEYIAQLGLKC